jgi:hypothetical protein
VKPILALLLLSLAVPALAEDAAHRADRLYTESLNRRAYASAQVSQGANERTLDRYRQERSRYEKRRAAWRQQVADCMGGDWERCD